MRKIKKLIIIILILILVVFLIMVVLRVLNKSRDIDGIGAKEHIRLYNTRVEQNASVFYTVEDCVQNYLDYTVVNLENTLEDKNYKYGSIYKLLDSDYITKNHITVDNISEHIKTSEVPIEFFALKMEYVPYENNLQEYRVYGKICNLNTGEFINYCYFKITLNTSSSVYCVEPISNCNSLEDIALDDSEPDKQIEYNLYNQYKPCNIEDNALMYHYLKYLKNALINSPGEVYTVLEENYRKENFPTLDSFKTFINKNKTTIEDIEFKSCEKEDNIVNKVFTCEDYNQKKYIFNQKAIMDFTLILEY